MKLNSRNSMIFIGILLLVLTGIMLSGKLNLGKNVYVVSPERSDSEQENMNKSDDLNNEIIESEEKIVYISGEVKTPGVVNLNKDDRLINAVEKLGGLTENADINRVNLAIKLEDGCHYIIPKIGENIQLQENATSEEVSSMSLGENTQTNNSSKIDNNDSSGKININSATLEQLNSLPGIGDVIAKRIIDYRNKSGKFRSIEDLNNVSGIGDKKFEGIKDLIIAN